MSIKFKTGDKIHHKNSKKVMYVQFFMSNYMILHDDKYFINGENALVFKSQWDNYTLCLSDKLKNL